MLLRFPASYILAALTALSWCVSGQRTCHWVMTYGLGGWVALDRQFLATSSREISTHVAYCIIFVKLGFKVFLPLVWLLMRADTGFTSIFSRLEKCSDFFYSFYFHDLLYYAGLYSMDFYTVYFKFYIFLYSSFYSFLFSPWHGSLYSLGQSITGQIWGHISDPSSYPKWQGRHWFEYRNPVDLYRIVTAVLDCPNYIYPRIPVHSVLHNFSTEISPSWLLWQATCKVSWIWVPVWAPS